MDEHGRGSRLLTQYGRVWPEDEAPVTHAVSMCDIISHYNVTNEIPRLGFPREVNLRYFLIVAYFEACGHPAAIWELKTHQFRVCIVCGPAFPKVGPARRSPMPMRRAEFSKVKCDNFIYLMKNLLNKILHTAINECVDQANGRYKIKSEKRFSLEASIYKFLLTLH